MARKLKTYQTSLGFFDLAIAAPSMKAAASLGRRQQSLSSERGEGKRRSGRHRSGHEEAWRRSQAPGWIRRILQRACRTAHRSWRRQKIDESRAQIEAPNGEEAFLASRRQGGGAEGRARYEREERRRESERAKEEAARQKEHQRRQQAVDQAQAALDKAEREHAKRAAAIQAEVEALEKRSQAEDARWGEEREALKAALQRARS
ncbi:flagellar motility protein MotE (MotC chaperone) [Bradyrhizobium sp. ERR14]|nr:flagellar motility protein MotE (MotC chaperone) [Bradyrhizobium sp. ERR14]